MSGQYQETDKATKILWKKVKASNRFRKLIAEYRIQLKIPKAGFRSFQEQWEWFLRIRGSRKHIYESFHNELEKLFPQDYKFLVDQFTGLADNYLFSGGNSWGVFDCIMLPDINVSGIRLCEIKQKNLPAHLRLLLEEPGLFIGFDSNTPIDHLHKFIDQHADEIREKQKAIREKLGIKKRPRIRESPNAKRDKKIYKLSLLSKEKLIALGAKNAPYKEMMIASLFPGLTSENVKRIINEQRKIHKMSKG